MIELSCQEQKSSGKKSSKPLNTLAVKELILLHPDTTLIPTGCAFHSPCLKITSFPDFNSTRHWFVGRKLDGYHHVRKHSRSHFERLARYLAGKSIGLVLSGGGESL